MEFLGHLVGEGSMSIPDNRVKALAEYTKPFTKKGLHSFLGAISFYLRYVHQLTTQTAVLSASGLRIGRVLQVKRGDSGRPQPFTAGRPEGHSNAQSSKLSHW